jgi:hypothetical protein
MNYEEMKMAEIKAIASERGIVPDGNKSLKATWVDALVLGDFVAEAETIDDSSDEKYPTIVVKSMVLSAFESLIWSNEMDEVELSGLDEMIIKDELTELLLQFERKMIDKLGWDYGELERETEISLEYIAHDVVLTVSSYGTGFWDRKYPEGLEKLGDELTVIANTCKEPSYHYNFIV